MADAIWPALGIAAFLMLVGRPIAVFACTAPFGYSLREIGFISWVGLRGAVGIFLASIPIIMRLESAALIFNVAFVVVVISLTVQGWTLGLAARVFDVALPHREREVRRVELDLPGSLERELVGYPVAADASILGRRTLPAWAQPTMVVRGGAILGPEHAGPLQAGDYVYLLTPPGRRYRLDWLFVAGEEAGAAEREIFGEFSFVADVTLGDIAAFYDLSVEPADAQRTLGEHFQRYYEHTVEIGDKVTLGDFTLIARELDGDAVSRVGLKLEGVRGVIAHNPVLRRSRLAAWIARRVTRP
jgi:cell volume regulation protein A